MLKYISLILFILTIQPIDAQSDWENNYNNILKEIVNEGKVDYLKARSKELDINRLYDTLTIDQSNNNQKVADLINAYNLIVIKTIIAHYPINSVQSISGFFKKKHQIGNEKLSLDEIEEKIIYIKKDGRIHFALVCGAQDCPPLARVAYRGETLENQLSLQTKQSLVLDNIFFVFEESTTLLVSKLFQWHQDDFGNLSIFWNQYTGNDYPAYSIKYADYNWSLNDISKPESLLILTNQSNSNINSSVLKGQKPIVKRYFASNLYTKGEYEVNVFNNYYSQTDPVGNSIKRENFFSTFIQGLWGINGRLNVGLDLKFRSVSSGPTNTIGLFDALNIRTQDRTATEYDNISESARFGITQIGPKIKYQPVKNIPGLTFQHSLYIPLLFNGEGGGTKDYIDWGSPSFYTDLYFDHQLTQNVSLFLQLGIYGENLGETFLGLKDGYYQLATPITTIINYFPTKKATVYFLVNSAPQFGFSRSNGTTTTIPNHYNQYGLGCKYFITDHFQGEVLVTKFSSVVDGRKAATYNLGIRYFGWR